MSTRYQIPGFATEGGMSTGLEGVDIPEGFDIPSCGIEDVDRAMFKLFNEDMPLYFELEGEMKRIPCIFAGGERAMILRRKKPLRDRQGALILPLVSILRNGIEQEADAGIGPGDGTITIRKKLAKEDRTYKRLINREGLRNQGNVPTPARNTNLDLGVSHQNVYEMITIPAPRFYKATYEVTFWAQYLQQMNNILEALISSYNINPARTFKIESPKGYWFVAEVEPGLSDSHNFDGYVDEERLIKTTITISVTGYIINPKFPGAPNVFRRFVSAPKVQFETSSEVPNTQRSLPIPSMDPNAYVFDDLNTEATPLPGSIVDSYSENGPIGAASIGGVTKNIEPQAKKMFRNLPVDMKNPFDGEPSKATVKAKNLKKGETVFVIMETLN